jgi:hypothetical protein
MSAKTYEDAVHDYYDQRTGTLGKILARSIDADNLTLTALSVLAYAQLEGGVKDLAILVVKHVNHRNLEIGEISPSLLTWRSESELERFKSALTFDAIARAYPFEELLKRTIKIRGIDRRYELNQMSSEVLSAVYAGFGLDRSQVELHSSQIDDLVETRNEAAHHGVTPQIEAQLMEQQLRSNVKMVGIVLTDLSLQLLSFFSGKLHLRPVAAP